MTDAETAREQAFRRVSQIRIAVQPRTEAWADGEQPDEDLALPDHVVDLLLDTCDVVRVERLSDADPDTWLVTGDTDTSAGRDTYARQAHTLVQRLLDTGHFARVEADLPVTAYATTGEVVTGEVADAPDLPGTEDPAWARRAIRCAEAWAVPPASDGTARGGGLAVGHPDTGYTLHPGLGRAALDLHRDRDVISGDDDARDPLVPPDRSPWLLPSPGHGTETGSVIAGRGGDAGEVVGVAPETTLVPVRAVESVVQLFDSDVARAVDHARRVGCRVVSMSLGGKGFFGLESAVRRAVDSGMIVMAAAGNRVGVVVAPASYPDCIAVAATGIGDRTWPGSSRGRAVDISAPGWSVHVAGFDWRMTPPSEVVRRGSGTSYAVAHVAGVAALWLGHHTVERIEATYGKARVQAVFLHLLRTVGRRVPTGWDESAWGAGIVDAEALVSAPLPDPDDMDAPIEDGPVGATVMDGAADRLARLVDVHSDALRSCLGRLFGVEAQALAEVVGRFEGELAYLLLQDRAFRDGVVAATTAGGMSTPAVREPPAASPDLVQALRRGAGSG